MFMPAVNVVWKDLLFTAATLPPMVEEEVSPSLQRLVECAILATRGSREEVTNWSSLARAMGVTAQVINNWKARGVSETGAIDAARRFGCSVLYVLDGTMDRRPVPRNNWVEPPEPKLAKVIFLFRIADDEGQETILNHARDAALRAVGRKTLADMESEHEHGMAAGVQSLEEEERRRGSERRVRHDPRYAGTRDRRKEKRRQS